MVAALCFSLPLLVFASYNFVKYILMTNRYKIPPLFLFYVLTIGSLLSRSIQFCYQIKYFYCYVSVINVAQAATIERLGAGICHAQILAKLYFDLDGLLHNRSNKAKSRLLTAVFIVIFVCSLSTQSVVSFWEEISV